MEVSAKTPVLIFNIKKNLLNFTKLFTSHSTTVVLQDSEEEATQLLCQ